MHECSKRTVAPSTYTPRSLVLLLSCWCISLVWATPIPSSASTEPLHTSTLPPPGTMVPPPGTTVPPPSAHVPPPNSTEPLPSLGVYPSNSYTLPPNSTESLRNSSVPPPPISTTLQPYITANDTAPPPYAAAPPPSSTVPQRSSPLPPFNSSSSPGPSLVAELLEPDEDMELNSTSESAIIAHYDAKKFLQTYGYMQTYNPFNGKWEYTTGPKVPWGDPLALNATSKPIPEAPTRTADKNEPLIKEEKRKFEKAVGEFQRRYSLQVTGFVNEETLRVMQQPRCGVPDYTEKVEDSKIDPKKAGWGKMKTSAGKSTPQTPVSKDSRALTRTLESKLSSVFGDRSTVASPATKVATRTRESGTLASEASKSSQPISISDLLARTFRPQDGGQVNTDGLNVRGTVGTTKLPHAVTVTPDTSSLAPVTTSFLSEAAIPRPRRSVDEYTAKIRTKRLTYDENDQDHDPRATESLTSYTKPRITWRILNNYYSSHFSNEADLRSQIARAFRRWAEKLPRVFVEMQSGDLASVDIMIAFVGSDNTHPHVQFADGELARTTNRHYIFFNEDIQWTYNNHQGKNLIKVAIHEIGHVLGLTHSNDSDSTMYAIYQPFRASDAHFRVNIDANSLTLAKNIHGTCAGSFDTILDWVRVVTTADNELKRKYSTVFFRGNSVWIYENTNERVKLGYPRRMSDMWSGVPTHVDAALQILSGMSDKLYFFKGNKYYQYDNVNRVLMTRDPVTNADISNGRLISEGWPAKPGFPRIPDDIDTAYYDKRDGNVYFLKGDWVYAYDMQADGCCLDGYPLTISTAYPYRYNSGGLPSNIDAAYYSISHRALYFFKGDLYWKSHTFIPNSSTVVNRMTSSSSWNQRWYDICEV